MTLAQLDNDKIKNCQCVTTQPTVELSHNNFNPDINSNDNNNASAIRQIIQVENSAASLDSAKHDNNLTNNTIIHSAPQLIIDKQKTDKIIRNQNEALSPVNSSPPITSHAINHTSEIPIIQPETTPQHNDKQHTNKFVSLLLNPMVKHAIALAGKYLFPELWKTHIAPLKTLFQKSYELTQQFNLLKNDLNNDDVELYDKLTRLDKFLILTQNFLNSPEARLIQQHVTNQSNSELLIEQFSKTQAYCHNLIQTALTLIQINNDVADEDNLIDKLHTALRELQCALNQPTNFAIFNAETLSQCDYAINAILPWVATLKQLASLPRESPALFFQALFDNGFSPDWANDLLHRGQSFFNQLQHFTSQASNTNEEIALLKPYVQEWMDAKAEGKTNKQLTTFFSLLMAASNQPTVMKLLKSHLPAVAEAITMQNLFTEEALAISNKETGFEMLLDAGQRIISPEFQKKFQQTTKNSQLCTAFNNITQPLSLPLTATPQSAATLNTLMSFILQKPSWRTAPAALFNMIGWRATLNHGLAWACRWLNLSMPYQAVIDQTFNSEFLAKALKTSWADLPQFTLDSLINDLSSARSKVAPVVIALMPSQAKPLIEAAELIRASLAINKQHNNWLITLANQLSNAKKADESYIMLLDKLIKLGLIYKMCNAKTHQEITQAQATLTTVLKILPEPEYQWLFDMLAWLPLLQEVRLAIGELPEFKEGDSRISWLSQLYSRLADNKHVTNSQQLIALRNKIQLQAESWFSNIPTILFNNVIHTIDKPAKQPSALCGHNAEKPWQYRLLAMENRYQLWETVNQQLYQFINGQRGLFGNNDTLLFNRPASLSLFPSTIQDDTNAAGFLPGNTDVEQPVTPYQQAENNMIWWRNMALGFGVLTLLSMTGIYFISKQKKTYLPVNIRNRDVEANPDSTEMEAIPLATFNNAHDTQHNIISSDDNETTEADPDSRKQKMLSALRIFAYCSLAVSGPTTLVSGYKWWQWRKEWMQIDTTIKVILTEKTAWLKTTNEQLLQIDDLLHQLAERCPPDCTEEATTEPQPDIDNADQPSIETLIRKEWEETLIFAGAIVYPEEEVEKEKGEEKNKDVTIQSLRKKREINTDLPLLPASPEQQKLLNEIAHFTQERKKIYNDLNALDRKIANAASAEARKAELLSPGERSREKNQAILLQAQKLGYDFAITTLSLLIEKLENKLSLKPQTTNTPTPQNVNPIQINNSQAAFWLNSLSISAPQANTYGYIDKTIKLALNKLGYNQSEIDKLDLNQTVTCIYTLYSSVPHGNAPSPYLTEQNEQFRLREVFLNNHTRDLATKYGNATELKAIQETHNPWLDKLLQQPYLLVHDQIHSLFTHDINAVLGNKAFDDIFYQITRYNLSQTLMTLYMGPHNGKAKNIIENWIAGKSHEKLIQYNLTTLGFPSTTMTVPGVLAILDRETSPLGGIFVSVITGTTYLWNIEDSSKEFIAFIRQHLSKKQNDATKDEDLLPSRHFYCGNYSKLCFVDEKQSYDQLKNAEKSRIEENFNGYVYTSEERRRDSYIHLGKAIMQFGEIAAGVAAILLSGGSSLGPLIAFAGGVGFGLGSIYLDTLIIANTDRGEDYREAINSAVITGILTMLGGAADSIDMLKALSPVARRELTQLAKSLSRHFMTSTDSLRSFVTKSNLFLNGSPQNRMMHMAKDFADNPARFDALLPNADRTGVNAVLMMENISGRITFRQRKTLSSTASNLNAKRFLQHNPKDEIKTIIDPNNLENIPAGYRIAFVDPPTNKLIGVGLTSGRGSVYGYDFTWLQPSSSQRWQQINLLDDALVEFTQHVPRTKQGNAFYIMVGESIDEFRQMPVRTIRNTPLLSATDDVLRYRNAILQKINLSNYTPESVLEPVNTFLQSEGFTSIKFRGLSIWDDSSADSYRAHFVVIGEKDNHSYAFDLLSSKCISMPDNEIDGPLVLLEEHWINHYQRVGERRLIMYRDFDQASDATDTLLPRPNNLNIDKYQDFTTYLTLPDWYKTAMMQKGIYLPENTLFSLTLGGKQGQIRSVASTLYKNSQIAGNDYWGLPADILKKSGLINQQEAQLIKQRAEAAIRINVPAETLVSDPPIGRNTLQQLIVNPHSLTNREQLIRAKEGQLLVIVDQHEVVQHMMLSLGNGKFMGIKNKNFFSTIDDDNLHVVIAEQFNLQPNGTLLPSDSADPIAGSYTLRAGYHKPVELPSLTQQLTQRRSTFYAYTERPKDSWEFVFDAQKKTDTLSFEQADALKYKAWEVSRQTDHDGISGSFDINSFLKETQPITAASMLDGVTDNKAIVFINKRDGKLAHALLAVRDNDNAVRFVGIDNKKILNLGTSDNMQSFSAAQLFDSPTWADFNVFRGKLDVNKTRDLALFGKDYQISAPANPQNATLTITIHGAAHSTNHMNAIEFADVLTGFLDNKPNAYNELKFISCYAGRGGHYSTAQILADRLKMRVRASSRLIDRVTFNHPGNNKVYFYREPSRQTLEDLQRHIRWHNRIHSLFTFWQDLKNTFNTAPPIIRTRSAAAAHNKKRFTSMDEFEALLYQLGKLVLTQTTAEFKRHYPNLLTEAEIKPVLENASPEMDLEEFTEHFLYLLEANAKIASYTQLYLDNWSLQAELINKEILPSVNLINTHDVPPNTDGLKLESGNNNELNLSANADINLTLFFNNKKIKRNIRVIANENNAYFWTTVIANCINHDVKINHLISLLPSSGDSHFADNNQLFINTTKPLKKRFYLHINVVDPDKKPSDSTHFDPVILNDKINMIDTHFFHFTPSTIRVSSAQPLPQHQGLDASSLITRLSDKQPGEQTPILHDYHFHKNVFIKLIENQDEIRLLYLPITASNPGEMAQQIGQAVNDVAKNSKIGVQEGNNITPVSDPAKNQIYINRRNKQAATMAMYYLPMNPEPQ